MIKFKLKETTANEPYFYGRVDKMKEEKNGWFISKASWTNPVQSRCQWSGPHFLPYTAGRLYLCNYCRSCCTGSCDVPCSLCEKGISLCSSSWSIHGISYCCPDHCEFHLLWSDVCKRFRFPECIKSRILWGDNPAEQRHNWKSRRRRYGSCKERWSSSIIFWCNKPECIWLGFHLPDLWRNRFCRISFWWKREHSAVSSGCRL